MSHLDNLNGESFGWVLCQFQDVSLCLQLQFLQTSAFYDFWPHIRPCQGVVCMMRRGLSPPGVMGWCKWTELNHSNSMSFLMRGKVSKKIYWLIFIPILGPQENQWLGPKTHTVPCQIRIYWPGPRASYVSATAADHGAWGAGGYALPLLQKTRIPEIKGFMGFPCAAEKNPRGFFCRHRKKLEDQRRIPGVSEPSNWAKCW